MARNRKIAAIRLVQRIKQHEIDGHATKLGTIRKQQATIQAEIDDLVSRRDIEGHISTPEDAPYLAGFLRSIKARCGFLAEQLATLDSEADEIEIRLRAAFRNLKENESALERSVSAETREQSRQEEAALEEVARNIYLRH